MRLRSLPFALAVVVALALTPTADAGAKPPKTYKGSIVITVETDDWIGTSNPSHTSDRIEVTGMKIKRSAYRSRGKREKATYKVTAGTAHWTSTETGRCTHTLDQTFDIIGHTPKPFVPLAFERVARGPWVMSGKLPLVMNADVPATCVDSPGAEPWTNDELLATPDLLYTGDASALVAPKRRLKHTFKDSVTNATTKTKLTWKVDWKG